MVKMRFYLLLVLIVSLVSCGGDDSLDNGGSVSQEAHIYRVVFEVSGTDYTAEAHVLNTENIPLFDETENKDLKQSSINESFKGKKIYYTTDRVQVFSAQGIILSDSIATLRMTVYEDGEEVYSNAVTVPDAVNDSNSLHYYKNNMVK